MANISTKTKAELAVALTDLGDADDIETKLNDADKIAGVTAGTATASKVVVLDSNKAVDAVRTASLLLGASGSEVAVASTAAELNLLDEGATEPGDAAWAGLLRVAKVEYDFAVDGGAVSAIGLGVNIPDNAVIVMASVDVLTTLTSSGDTATGAISVEGANDIVTAIAINDGGNPWDVGIGPLIAVDPTDSSKHVKTSAAKAVTFTIAVEAVTAGKFNVYLFYVISE